MVIPAFRSRCAEPRRIAVCGAALAAVLILPAAPGALAQAGGGAADPGKIRERIERPPTPAGKVDKIAPAPLGRAIEAGTAAARFVLVGAEVTGATVYTAERLGDFYEPYLGRSIGLAEVEAIVNAITEQYRKDGYFLSRAVAPPQTLDVGVLRIRVIEGYIEDVRIAGAQLGRPGIFEEWRRRITAGQPARLGTIERTLLLMADIPGVTARPAVSEVDADRGAYRLSVLLEHDATSGIVTLDNRGTTPVGPLQTYAAVTGNSWLGLLERTRLAIFTTPQATEELLYFEFEQSHLLDSQGTRGWVTLSASNVDTGDAGRPSKQNSRGKTVTLGLSHPLLRRREYSLLLSARLDIQNSVNVTPASSFDDRLRVVRIGGDFTNADSFGGLNTVSLVLSKGFDMLGATDPHATRVSRANGRSDFFKTRIDLGRYQRLGEKWGLQLAAAAQTTPHTLLSAEEFFVGGQRFGRGYDPAVISGSKGAAASVEFQYAPSHKLPVAESWQLYDFYDIGAVWSAGFSRESLASAGGGIRLGLPLGVGAGFEVAQPLTRPRTPGEGEQGGPRLFFSLRAQF